MSGLFGLPAGSIGLGLAAVGRPGYITVGHSTDLGPAPTVERLERRCHDLLDAAWAAGVRYIDVARSYGLAEQFLASWLDRRGLPDGALVVASKWGYRYTADWQIGAAVHELKDHSLATLRRQLAESRQLLGDRLCLYQVHSATLESGVLDDRAVLAELVRLSDVGLRIGLSISGPRQAEVLRRALAARMDGRNPFTTVQATWNVLEPSVGAALAEVHAAGWGVIVKEALANGRLAQPGPGRVSAVLRAIARRRGTTVDAVALAAARANPWADIVLSGAATVAQLVSNLAAASVELQPDDLAALSGLAEPPERYWAERSALAWN